GYAPNRQNYLLVCSSNPGFPLQRRRCEGGCVLATDHPTISLYRLTPLTISSPLGVDRVGERASRKRRAASCWAMLFSITRYEANKSQGDVLPAFRSRSAIEKLHRLRLGDLCLSG